MGVNRFIIPMTVHAPHGVVSTLQLRLLLQTLICFSGKVFFVIYKDITCNWALWPNVFVIWFFFSGF